MRASYVIGLDFGTLSGRALLVNTRDGEPVASAVMDYPHGILTECLPDGRTRLPADWCLQDPNDYVEVLCHTVNAVVEQARIPKEEIVGIAMDFTASTILPVDRNGVPLCNKPGYADRPHAYVKLWKHHAAQPEANEINRKLRAFPNHVADYYGPRISSEILLPKALQILHEDPALYREMDALMEAPDWLNFLMTGRRRRSINTVGYKAMYFNEAGYPPPSFFREIHPDLERFTEEKLRGQVCRMTERFGELNGEWAERLRLQEGTAVGCSMIDAHAGVIGCGITAPGRMMLALGTSSVQTVLSETPYSGSGVIGAIRDAVIPGYFAWESGLAAVGDQLAWYVEKCVEPEANGGARRVQERMQSLSERAARLQPGESGLLALDWWNGNKTPFVNGCLAGVVVGMRLDTTSEKIFRALMEATAFGTMRILETFEQAGCRVKDIVACGGVAYKNAPLMQIYADVLGREIRLAGCDQTAALGAAIVASIAAGGERGGYDAYDQAARRMTRLRKERYLPNWERHAVYQRLYQEYRELTEYFGGKHSGLFDRLNELAGRGAQRWKEG